jgi:hypothetical protein
MNQPFYNREKGLYCKLFEDDEDTFVLTFYRYNKQVNAILSDISKGCRESFFDYLKEKYELVRRKYPEEDNNYPIYVDLNAIIAGFCRESKYSIFISQEKRMIKEEFISPEEKSTLDYIVIKEISNKYFLTKEGVLAIRETK